MLRSRSAASRCSTRLVGGLEDFVFSTIYIYICIYIYIYIYMLGISSSQLTKLIFFRGGLAYQPPGDDGRETWSKTGTVFAFHVSLIAF